ncbi:MAG: hypothetical protein JNL81_06620 [Hyphomonadaceae bacterium]|nr:hypothetical protein [Hyphomonadaceae bacterium]
MSKFDAGVQFACQIVVNRTNDQELTLPPCPFPVSIAYRENVGMNIGAWEHGWRLNPESEHFLFLQDECLVVRENWGLAFSERCADPGVGLVGEAFNPAWEHTWDRLRALHRGSTLQDHFVDGRPAGRIDAYLDAMKRWGVDPGATGGHLRSLAWAASRDTLSLIGGFPIGANYGECIAAEIAVSRKCVASGRRLVQVREAPFYFVHHREWTQEAPGAAFYHSRKAMPDARWDTPERAQLDSEAARVDAILRRLPAVNDKFDQALVVASLACKLADREAEVAALRARLGRKETRT